MNEPRFELMETEEQRAHVFRLLQRYRLDKVMMHELTEPTVEAWVDMIEPGLVDLWLDEDWGIFYMSQFLGRTPLFHFAVWPHARKDAKKFMCAAVNHAVNIYDIDAMLGLTPAKYMHVTPLALSTGWKLVCRIPGAINMRGKAVDGNLFMWSRT